MSGFYRSLVDLFIDCVCGWAGSVEAVEDGERFSLTWECPGCGHVEEEDMG